jgi:hypothetical protein
MIRLAEKKLKQPSKTTVEMVENRKNLICSSSPPTNGVCNSLRAEP